MELILPEKYDLVVGDFFELFFQGILNAADWRFFDFEMTFDRDDDYTFGQCYRRKYTITPKESDIGDHPVTIRVRDYTGALAAEGRTNFRVWPVAQNPAEEKTVLCIGDSLTVDGQWPAEFHRRLRAVGLTNLRFIGTSMREDTPYVGFGGWQFNTYNQASCLEQFQYLCGSFTKTVHDQHALYTDEQGYIWKLEAVSPTRIKVIRQSRAGVLTPGGTLTHLSGGQDTEPIRYDRVEQAEGNPFWDPTNARVDFAGYAAQKGVKNLDFCHILLGWNCHWQTEAEFKPEVRKLLDAILSDFPDCRISLIGLQVGSRDGFGANYGVAWKYYEKLQFVWSVERWYEDICREPAYAGRVEFVQLSGQFDTEYSMPTMVTHPNCRSSVEIELQSNGLHPNESGYLQIADAVFRHQIARLQEIG